MALDRKLPARFPAPLRGLAPAEHARSTTDFLRQKTPGFISAIYGCLKVGILAPWIWGCMQTRVCKKPNTFDSAEAATACKAAFEQTTVDKR